MEEFLNALGAFSLIVLVLIGLIAGFVAGKLAGRNTALYMVIGVVGAVALPFFLAALGIGLVAMGGLILVLIVAAIGAAILLAIARALFR